MAEFVVLLFFVGGTLTPSVTATTLPAQSEEACRKIVDNLTSGAGRQFVATCFSTRTGESIVTRKGNG